MAFDKWTMPYSALLLLVFSIGNIDAQSCGGNYTEDYGVFMSPNYPDVYALNVDCIYRITPSTMSSITLNFETFELDRSAEDYVSITCESDTGYVPKNFTWNYDIAPISIPSCNIAQLYFHSDSSHNYSTKGFRVQYQVNTEGCGNTAFTSAISTPGNISSPNYPQNYNDDENCTYSIWAPETSSFTLTFEAFDLESDCRYDWVQIRCDNSSYISPKYCGSTLPKPATITNCNKVLIWFHADSSNAFSGFSLQYSRTANGCGELIYAGLSGIITSPNYPMGYRKSDCLYILRPISSIALAFQSFDLEPFIQYNAEDLIWITCLFIDSTSVDYFFRGNTLPPLIFCPLSHTVNIHFYANNAISGTGFNVRYQHNPVVAHSAIIDGPKNFTVDVGNQVQLDCTSDAKDYYPSWTLSKDGIEENIIPISGYCDALWGDRSKYSVVKGGPGVCSLMIRNVTLAEAGIYTCIDVGLASSSSVVTVVDLHDDNQK